MWFQKIKVGVMLYPAAIEIGNETTAFSVIFPDVAGCFSAGDSYAEALINAREALEMHFELLADMGELPPNAGSVADYCEQPEYAGFAWEVINIDIYR